jgi:hypothetical protein
VLHEHQVAEYADLGCTITYFFIEINGTYFYSDHIYIDVFHEHQVAEYADLGCTIPFACECAKSNPRPCDSDVRCVQLCSYDVCPHTAHCLLVWELGSSSHRRSIQQNHTMKAEIRLSMLVAVL